MKFTKDSEGSLFLSFHPSLPLSVFPFSHPMYFSLAHSFSIDCINYYLFSFRFFPSLDCGTQSLKNKSWFILPAVEMGALRPRAKGPESRPCGAWVRWSLSSSIQNLLFIAGVQLAQLRPLDHLGRDCSTVRWHERMEKRWEAEKEKEWGDRAKVVPNPCLQFVDWDDLIDLKAPRTSN